MRSYTNHDPESLQQGSFLRGCESNGDVTPANRLGKGWAVILASSIGKGFVLAEACFAGLTRGDRNDLFILSN
jgi:hypothetical protein